VQRAMAVSASGGIKWGRFIERMNPRFARFIRPPYPALLLELVGHFAAWIRVNALRCGEYHLRFVKMTVATEISITAVAEVDHVLAALPWREPQFSVRAATNLPWTSRPTCRG
jgi:hypothetical protein